MDVQKCETVFEKQPDCCIGLVLEKKISFNFQR